MSWSLSDYAFSGRHASTAALLSLLFRTLSLVFHRGSGKGWMRRRRYFGPMHGARLWSGAFRQMLLLCLLACFGPQAMAASLVVVVDARSDIERLSRNEVVNIFMGRYRVLPSGEPAHPFDHPTRTVKASFYKKLLGKDMADINAYWARLLFSGRTAPPRQAQSLREMIDWLSSQRGGVAYLEREQVDNRVKIVLELP